jgi:Raf kinase inhibitor-like YbhB/YbcL family protein
MASAIKTTLQLTSSVFRQGEAIPSKYTCDGANVSPPLEWSEPPAGTKAFALIADDPDAPGGTWVHWVLYNVPAMARVLREDVSKDADFPKGVLEGMNDFQKSGYGGPCPPAGSSHRYFFRLYALDIALSLPMGAKRQAVDSAMKGHVLGQAELIGSYRRQR